MKKQMLLFIGLTGLIAISCNKESNAELQDTETTDTTNVATYAAMAFDTIPSTLLCEESVAEFDAITAEKFLDVIGSYVYAQNMEYICYREGDNIYYKRLSSLVDDEYNVFNQLEGRPGRYVAFQEGFTTAQYENMSDGKGDIVLEYHPFRFDEDTQTIGSKGIDGYAVEEGKYKLAYVDANYIVLESTISEKAKHTLAIDDAKPYFVREILARHTEELKTPTIVRDYRE